ncbi:MAG: zinc-dependent alcohol dehydrogenase [Candidatus Tyrphobacter sp.]
MRVAVLVEPRRIELREESAPSPADGAIVVRVRAALTDGTDLKAFRRGHPQMPMPTRFGHEFSGDVVATGAGVSAFAVGDAVACVHTAPCGACAWCLRGEEELCEELMPGMLLGAYADAIEVPARVVGRNCFVKPPAISYVEAAFLEPLSCVVHSLHRSAASGRVAIIGDGAFGILHALLLHERGAEPILVGRRAERLQLARAYGFDPVDARAGNAADAVRGRTDGFGADAVIECTGTQSAWESAPGFVRRGGTVALFGGLPSDATVTFAAGRIHYDELRIVSPFHFTPRAVRAAYEILCARRFDLVPLVTDAYPLHDIANAFAQLDAGIGMKACIEP